MPRKRRGFSLIELLIVLAVIGILTAVAVPNFVRAKMRSDISRVKADLRTMAVAIESYWADVGKPPPQSAGLFGTPFSYIYDPQFPGIYGTGTLTYAITTPVAYLSTHLLYDPFVQANLRVSIDERVYTYMAYQWKWPEYVTSTGITVRPDTTAEAGSEQYTGLMWKATYGKWKVLSIGPDCNYFNIVPRVSGPWVATPYDPTNGLTSFGNITRSEKHADQTTVYVP